MKKFITIILSWCLLASLFGVAQDLDNSTKEKSRYKNPDSPVDNMGFRMRMVEEGIVPYNAPIPVKPAEYIGSRVKGDPIDQMSTDVCLWNETGVTESENSVFIDPDNAQYILNSNNSEQSGSIYGCNYILSSNAGLTWTGSKQGAGGNNSGDPTTAIGRNGRHYIGYITSSNYGQGVAWSDNGTTWNPVTSANGPGYPDLLDKNHMMIDNRASGTYSGYVYNAWTRFETGHTNDTDIEFNRSTTNGTSWSTPINISNAIAAGSHNQGVNIQTGPTGQVYAVWAVYDDWGPGVYYEDAIGFARSTSGGGTFAAATRIHNNIKGIRSWAYNSTVGKTMRVNSFPSMAVDVSGGSYNGYIYVVWANLGVPGTNTGTNVSVYCMRSTDGGFTWGIPVRVNQGSSADGYASYFPWITCDPVSGKLYCIFYDDRNLGTTSSACEVWVAYSENGGTTWSDFRVGDVSFTPAPIAGLADDYMGDYIGITARNNWVYPCWTDNRSGRALTYVSPIHFTNYCIASGGCDEYISNVQIGSINNSSSCEGYQNFTNLSTSIPVNSSSVLTITNGTPYGSDQCGVWVDWNNDGDFIDTGETMTVSVTPGTGPYTATIAPPAGTSQGTKTMRIRIMYTGTLSPCGNTTYGEVEDYSINVSAMVPNVWDGSYNYYWHNNNNWSLGHIPTSTEEVIIPNVGYQPISVDYYDEACANLTIETGSVVNIYDQTLTVNGILTINGQIGMLQDNANLYAMSNVVWNSGSTLNVTATNSFINVYGSWNYNAGSNVNPAMGFVDFEGATDCWIRCYSPTSSFYNFRIYKSGGAVAKFSNVSSNDLVVNNLTFITTGGIFQSLSNYNIVMKGNFNYYGTFDFTQSGNTGSVVFDGTSQTINNYSSGSGIFNNVEFSSSTGTTVASGDLTINGNLTINQGNFNSGSVNITLGGNWTNNIGPDGFIESTGRVIFDGGNYHQYCSNETFNILEVNKPTGGALRPYDGHNIVCAAYDWTAGAVDVIIGSFTANDLLDNGIFGAYYCNAGGTINLNNLSGNLWVDLNGELHIYGGTVNVSGAVSDWPYAANAVIEMTDGVLDFKTCGININNSAYTLTNNITGGVIRTAVGFSGNRSDFTPTAGTFEFYGTSDAFISQSNGCTLWNVNINKSAKNTTNGEPILSVSDERIDKTVGKGGKANSVSLNSNIVITNGLNISSGTLEIGGYTCSVSRTVNVYGILSMTNPIGVLNVGTYAYDNLRFYSGSTGNLAAGNINLNSWIVVDAGSTFTASTSNTIHIIGSNSGGGLANSEPSALFGNVNIDKTTNASYLASDYMGPYNIQGNFTVQPGNSFQTGWNSMHVTGLMTDQPTSSIYLYYASKDVNSQTMTSKEDTEEEELKSGAKGGGLTIDTDFTLNGLLDVSDGNALVHGIFHLASTGNLNITSGSFIADGPLFAKNWEYIDGHLGLTSGLFEITNNSIYFSSTATTTISGGIMRSGEAFGAQDPGVFQPSGGTVEIVGVGSNTIYCSNGNYFYNLLINRDPAAESFFYTDITVNNNLTVNSGTLTLDYYTANVLGGVTLNGGTFYIIDNANLLLAGGTALNVNNGGKLSVIGSSGFPGRVSRISTGNYAFNVQSGGTIAAQYGLFEYMSTNGVNLLSGSLVDPVYSFHNCTFQNGQTGGTLLTVNNNQTFYIENAIFPTNTWTGASNVTKSVNSGMVYFVTSTGGFAGEGFDNDPNSRIMWTNRSLSLKAFLEGPFNGTNMNSTLNGILPLSHPFNPALPYFGNPMPDWRFTGAGSVAAIPNVNIVDWVLVDLRDAVSAAAAVPATSVAKFPAFILNNGNIVGLNGSSNLEFTGVIANNLFVVIYHRNHQSIMNASPVPYTAGAYTYDYTTGAAQVYGNTAGHKELSPGKWGMRSGDGNGDGDVLTNDKTQVWGIQTQLGKTGYLPSDFNFDRQTNNKDKNDKWFPNLGSGSMVP